MGESMRGLRRLRLRAERIRSWRELPFFARYEWMKRSRRYARRALLRAEFLFAFGEAEVYERLANEEKGAGD